MIRQVSNFIRVHSYKLCDIMSAKMPGEKRSVSSDTRQLSEDEKQQNSEVKRPKLGKRRKVALLVMYSGKGYHGVQIQANGLPTIESELVKALQKNEIIDQSHVDDMSKMWFQRASRTDKGVSAAGQVFSLLINQPDIVTRLNSDLPPGIRIVGVIRTTKGFDAQHNCSHRTYEYMTPTFAFAPIDQRTTEEYRINDKTIQEINKVLRNFKGTHNFFNFTSRRKADDKSTNRYMMSLEAGKPFIKDGLEYLIITVRGQSFMLHQIRKMIGLTIAIVRGLATEDIFELCWAPDRVDIPKAPGLGLLLDKLHYDGYNKKFGKCGEREPLDWSKYEEEIVRFKEQCIYADIMKTEKEEKSMWQWLQTLPLHSFQIDTNHKGESSSKNKSDNTDRSIGHEDGDSTKTTDHDVAEPSDNG